MFVKIRNIIINTFLSRRNVCLFLEHKNLHFGIQWTLGKHFLSPAYCGSIFPAKSCRDAWRSGSQLARGQVNMMNEAKCHSPIPSTFETLVVWWTVRHGHEEILDLLCWPMLPADVAVLGHLIDLLSILLRFNGFIEIQKVVVVQTGSRPWNSDHDVFLLQAWLWEIVWSCFSVQPLNWSSPVVICCCYSVA